MRVTKRTGKWLILFATLAGCGYSWSAWTGRQRERNSRELAYSAVVRNYAQKYRPGLRREEVEAALAREKVQFQRVGHGAHEAYSDLVKIGEENPALYCSENHIYVAFKFVRVSVARGSVGEGRLWSAEPTDILVEVELLRQNGGCL